MTDSYVIGVDAGGTKTTAWRCASSGAQNDEPIATGHDGPGNANSVGFETAAANIRMAIESAMQPTDQMDCLCICAAGAGRAEQQERLFEWASGLKIARHIRIETDIDALLAAASPDSVGVALIAGTGSLAAGRNAAGKTHRAGGWGWLLGDEGSAYHIGRTALQHAVRMADGREPETPLLGGLLGQLDLTEPSELVNFFYASPNSRSRIAQLSQHVFDIAASGDAASAVIIDHAASELAAMVETVAAQLSLPTSHTLAMTGGVLMNQPTYRRRVLSLLSRGPDQVELVENPVRGAVHLARRYLSNV